MAQKYCQGIFSGFTHLLLRATMNTSKEKGSREF